VFLIDVSGSMNDRNKLPLVKRGLELLVEQLGENDRVAIAVYAGAAGTVLPSTNCSNRAAILESLDRLNAGGSTNGGAGIHLAYRLAREHLIKDGVNRVILCSDGDFNVGTTDSKELIALAAENAKSGVFLSILGFGIGNHNDALLEQVANQANGNYAFIDSEAEARKVLVDQMTGTLTAIAKDVKIQVEFNPAQVASYRLIGYENRVLAARDFNDDKKDAGEIGAGHTVTALYEIVPAGAEKNELVNEEIDGLKYQTSPVLAPAAAAGELLTVKLRYKPVDGDTSTLLAAPFKDQGARFSEASDDLRFASAVAMFGMLLRDSAYAGDASFDQVIEIATAARANDPNCYRQEFVELVELARDLNKPQLPPTVPDGSFEFP
jgi:Ca-activated chloride channel family protein